MANSRKGKEHMIRFGIIGCGIMGLRQARQLRDPEFQPHASVSAVYDSDPARASAAAREFGAQACGSLEQIVSGGLVDAVYIATPDDAHRDPFLAAVESGIAVLVEKPLATTLEDARAMLSASKELRQVAEINWGNRWHLPFVSVKSAIEDGEIGQVRSVKAWLSNTQEVPLNMLSWASRSTCGWFLLSHVFDVTTWLTGTRPIRVFARGTKDLLRNQGVDTYDYLHALVEYDNGSTGLYESSWILPPGLGRLVDFQYHVMGSAGTATVDLGHQMVEVAGPQLTRWPREVSYARDRMFAFIEACKAGVGDSESIESGFYNTATLVALHESVVSGEVVEIGKA
jgi:predicted dehydrogenase